MKKSLGTLFLVMFCAFGAALLLRDEPLDNPFVIIQPTRNAIINVDTVELAEGLLSGKIKIEYDQPESRTLLKINTGRPTQLKEKLDISNGELFIINPHGVIVGEGETILPIGSGAVVNAPPSPTLKAHGNVYALAINQDDAIKASKPITLETPEDSSDAPAESDD